MIRQYTLVISLDSVTYGIKNLVNQSIRLHLFISAVVTLQQV
jgi:hypothetical protein